MGCAHFHLVWLLACCWPASSLYNEMNSRPEQCESEDQGCQMRGWVQSGKGVGEEEAPEKWSQRVRRPCVSCCRHDAMQHSTQLGLAEAPELHGADLKLLLPRQAAVAKGGAVAGQATGEVGIQPQRVAAEGGRGVSGAAGGGGGSSEAWMGYSTLSGQHTALCAARGAGRLHSNRHTAAELLPVAPATQGGEAGAPTHPPAPPTAMASFEHHWK